MRHSGTTLLFSALLLMASGCMKPSTPPVPQAPFAIDPPIPPLDASCGTANLAGCANARALEQSVATMVALHEAQMAEMRGALSSLQGVLNRPDGTPTANIEASPLPVQDWLDVNAKYPAELVVRFEAQRGLSHMGGSSINDMKGALANVERVSKEHSAQWRSALNQQPRGLVLPNRVLRARFC